MSGKAPNSEYSSLAPVWTDDVFRGDGLKRSAAKVYLAQTNLNMW